MPSPLRPNDRRRRAALTLVELLVVLVILSMLALSTVSLAGNTDSQLRFEDTRARLHTIRRGVAGTPEVVANGRPLVNGFVADMGRLPSSVRELLDPPTADPPPQPWAFTYRQLDLPGIAWASPAGVAAGWRGPYLPAVREVDGRLAFRDGWGAPDQVAQDPQCGWVFAAGGGSLGVQSLGANFVSGGNLPYDADYPPTGTPLLERVDHAVDLGATPLAVAFQSAAPSGTRALRLRVYVPRVDATGVTWVYEDSLAQSVSTGAPSQVAFSFSPATWAVWGHRLVVVVEDAPLPADRVPHQPTLNSPQPLTLVPRASLPQGTLFSWRLD